MGQDVRERGRPRRRRAHDPNSVPRKVVAQALDKFSMLVAEHERLAESRQQREDA